MFQTIRKFLGTRKRNLCCSRQASLPTRFKSRLQVEEFEDRMLLSTLNVAFIPRFNIGHATYTGTRAPQT
jgi:hypothetical protein